MGLVECFGYHLVPRLNLVVDVEGGVRFFRWFCGPSTVNSLFSRYLLLVMALRKKSILFFYSGEINLLFSWVRVKIFSNTDISRPQKSFIE